MMSNPFKQYKFKEEVDRVEILKNFDLLYRTKADNFPRLKLMQVYRAFKDCIEGWEMSLEDLQQHLDALAGAPNNDLSKKGDEYYMAVV